MILGKEEIIKLNAIVPFDEKNMDGESYLLTASNKQVIVDKDNEYVTYFDGKIQPSQHVNILSNEIVFMPDNLVGWLTAKSKYGRLGLSFLNAGKIHSGFKGRIVIEVSNLSDKTVTINKGDHLMHLLFCRREGSIDPYRGVYQCQYLNI